MFLRPKEAMFKKPDELSQHLKPLYIRGHIDRRLIFRMLIDGGIAVDLTSYAVFKKLAWKDNELMKANLTLNSMGGGGVTRWMLEASSPWSSSYGASHSLPRSSSSRCKVTIVLFLVAIGLMPNIVFLLLCTNS
jgi:hypothetical protein